MTRKKKYLAITSLGLLLLLCVFAAWFSYALFHRVEGQYFDSNGVRIHYIDEGKGGEPVILVHGYAANIDANWRKPGILDELKKDHRVIALDDRGHGLSDKPHDPAQYGTNMADDVVRLMDHLKIDKAHIVGYSMGGFITLKLLSMKPERFLSATIGGAGHQVAKPEDVAAFNGLADSLESGNGFAPLFIKLTPIGQEPNHARIVYFNAILSMLNDELALAAVMRSFALFKAEEPKLAANTVPTLVICGTKDPLRVAVEALEPLMPNEEVVWVQDADHITVLGKPEFKAAIHGFIDKHAAAK